MNDNYLFISLDHNSFKIATPGNTFPSSNSNDAPPPVLTWLTLDSAWLD